jgi:hypothetical protein
VSANALAVLRLMTSSNCLLLDRKGRRVSAFQDPVDEDGRAPKHTDQARAV